MEQMFSSFSGGLSQTFSSMSSSAGSLLQGGATALSALSSITAGRMARNSGDTSAAFSFYAADFARQEGELAYRSAELDASSEEIAGRARSNALREDLVQTIGAQQVAYAASGGGLSGTAARMQDQTARRAAQDIAIEKSNTEIARLQSLIRGSTTRRQARLEATTLETEGRAARARGRNAEKAGYLAAGEKMLGYAADVLRRK